MLSAFVRLCAWCFNLVGAVLRWAGLELAPLRPDDLRALARRQTGLEDLGEMEYPDALEVLCGSLESEAQLTLLGRVALRKHLGLALQERLQRIELRKRRPEVFSAPLNRPLIVLGLPRSGTTFLHRLLVEAPGTRALKTWEIRRAFPPVSGPDRRRDEARLALWVLRNMAPELDTKHVLDPDAAEEEVGLFDSALWSASPWRLAAARSYLSWYLTQDPEPGYRVFREMLQWFQAEDPTARLVLKLPNHLGFIETLMRVIPEADVVQTHRAPAPVIASYCSLMNSVHAISASRVDRVRSGRDAMELWGRMADGCVAQRASIPEGRILDVGYAQLLEDPVGVVRSVHRHVDLPWTDADAERTRALVAQRQQNRHGKHVYALQDVHLDEASVNRRFASYRERFIRQP